MLGIIVSASIVTALVSLVCIIGIPWSISPTKWGARILTGIKTPFAFLLSGHVVVFFLATLVGLLVGSILLRGRVSKSFFWIIAAIALVTSLVELVTDLGWLAQRVMGRKPQPEKRVMAEKGTMLLGAAIGIVVWFLIVRSW
ncbi:MAG TPA: hypothetical protein VN739_04075 [Nitrososphaerales archaeon]|nr:hypothetical protein [Nitrososphaerales archaeon]